MKGNHELMLEMINKLRDKGTPLPDIAQICEADRISQVRSERDSRSVYASYDAVNKKDEVSSKDIKWRG